LQLLSAFFDNQKWSRSTINCSALSSGQTSIGDLSKEHGPPNVAKMLQTVIPMLHKWQTATSAVLAPTGQWY
jgi:hypothetical protein